MNAMYVNETVFTGRPAAADGRLEKEMKCYDVLDALGIAYLRAEHDFADTIEACEQVEQVLGLPCRGRGSGLACVQEPVSVQPAEDAVLPSDAGGEQGL